MSDLSRTVRGMDYLIQDYARYGDLLVHLSTCKGEISGEVLRLIGYKMSIDGEELTRRFDDAVKLLVEEVRA